MTPRWEYLHVMAPMDAGDRPSYYDGAKVRWRDGMKIGFRPIVKPKRKPKRKCR